MSLPLSRHAVPLLVELASTPSTNTELLARSAREVLPGFSTVVTSDQTGGRGRLDRVWEAPRGSSLAISVLVRTRGADGALPVASLGWLPLVAGVAMAQAVTEEIDAGSGSADDVELKWPNDVLVGGRKVCGILAELTPTGDAVIGSGLNTTMTADQLPVPTATSLVLAGADPVGIEDRVLSRYLTVLQELTDRLLRADGDATGSGIHALVSERCATLGRRVRVELPGGEGLDGVAQSLDGTGRLVVQPDVAGRVVVVSAGDVTHLRYE